MTRFVKPVLLSALILCTAIPAFADSCSFAFPQNANYPYGIKPNNFTSAQMNAHVMSWYNQWFAKYVTQNNCTGSEWRVQRTETGNGITNGCYGFATAPQENDTVSEEIGYGMVIMVFMSSATNNTRQYFDGFYTYYKDHLDGAGLMNWQLPYCNSGGSATDADEDVAFALLAADKQWGSGGTINYKNEANTIIGRVLNNEITASNDIRPGDGWDGANISYFAPYEYRMFGDYTGTTRWYQVASHTYQTIVNYYYNSASTNNAALGMKTGLQPNWCNYDGTTWSPGAWSMDPNTWWWDAIRHAWRQSYDYLLYGTTNSQLAQDNNTRLSSFFQAKSGGDAAKILSHYTLDGTAKTYNRGDRTPDLGVEDAMNLPGPEGAVAIAAMVGGDQDWLNECYYTLVTMDAGTGSGKLTETGVDWGTDYFCDILKMQYLLILTGNMPNPMGNYPTPTITPTVTFGPSPTPVPQGIFDDFETGAIVNLDTSGGGQTAFTAVVNNTVKPQAGLRSLQITSTANGWGAYGQDSPYTGGLGYRNETGATALDFYIYSTAGITFFTKLVEATANGGDGETYATRASTNTAPANAWTHIIIPISNFKRDDPNSVVGNGVLNLSAIKSFYLQIDAAPNATIWIDNIQFTGTFPSPTPTYTATRTKTPNGSPTNTPTITQTRTNTPYYSPTITPTNTVTMTSTLFISATITQTSSITPTWTVTPNIPLGIFDDFETGVLKNPAVSDTGGGAALAISNTAADKHAGARSMLMSMSGANGWAVGTIDSPYDGGLGYRDFTGATGFSFWINAPAGSGYFVKIVETNGQQWSNRGAGWTAAGGWQNVAVPLTLFTVDQYSPTGDGDSVLNLNIIKSITFQFDNPGTKIVYIDDIMFTGIPAPTSTRTPTRTPTYTVTPAGSPTITPTRTGTQTFTPYYSPTFTSTLTPTVTNTPYYSPTFSYTQTASPTYSGTYTRTLTATNTLTRTATSTGTPTATMTVTPTMTATASPDIFDDFETGVLLNPVVTNDGTDTMTVVNTNTAPHAGTRDCMITFSSPPTSWGGVFSIGSPYHPDHGNSDYWKSFTGATAVDFWIKVSGANTKVFIKVQEAGTGAVPINGGDGEYWSDRGAPTTIVTAGVWTEVSIPLSSLSIDANSGNQTGNKVMDLQAINDVAFQFNTGTVSPIYIDDIRFTGMPLPTSTRTPSYTATATGTATPTNTVSSTKTASPTLTATPTHTGTYTPTGTRTATCTITVTYSVSPTITQTWTGTPPTSTNTPTVTLTSSRSATPTLTGTPTGTPTDSPTSTGTATDTPTGTFTATPTDTLSATPTFTPTATASETMTMTATPTYTVTATASISPTYSVTPSITMTVTGTPPTPTSSATASVSPSSSFTGTTTATDTFTATATGTDTPSFTPTATPSGTATKIPSPSNTTTLTATVLIPSETITQTFTGTPTPAISSPTPTPTGIIPAPTPFAPMISDPLAYPDPWYGGRPLYIQFETSRGCSNVNFKLYTASFRLVISVDNGACPAGTVTEQIPADRLKGLASGTYYYLITGTDAALGRETRAKAEKLIIIK